MRISVIIPCHNCEAFLGSCLESLIGQSFIDWECIIVDDGSTDDSLRLAKKYEARDSRFRVLSQVNKGPGSARNLGIFNALGDWVYFLDSDDLLKKNVLLSRIVVADYFSILDSSGCVVYGPHEYFMGDSGGGYGKGHKNYGDDLRKALVAGNVFAIDAVLVDRNALLKVSGFDESLLGVEDWDLWFRLALNGVKFISSKRSEMEKSEVLVRLREGSLSADKLYMLEWELRAREKWAGFLSTESGGHDELINENIRRIFHRKIRVAIYYFFAGSAARSRVMIEDVISGKGVVWCVGSVLLNLVGMAIKGEVRNINKI